MTACLALVAVLAASQGDKGPPPLTDTQRDHLNKIVSGSQKHTFRLKEQLDKKQRALGKLYADYDLDEKAAKKLQDDILDLQKQLLADYHRTQVEIRRVVGPERFQILRQRIDRILGPMKD